MELNHQFDFNKESNNNSNNDCDKFLPVNFQQRISFQACVLFSSDAPIDHYRHK